MKEKLEKVIAELEREVGFCDIVLESDPFDLEQRASKSAYQDAIDKLKAVLEW